MASRPTLTVASVPAWRVPVHPTHRVALVGEAPSPAFRPDVHDPNHYAMYPYPERSAAGRLKKLLGWSRTEYLQVFARANLLDFYPGQTFPLAVARPLAAPLAQRLAPRPLILLGRGVAGAFSLPTQEVCEWQDYLLGSTLIRAAMIPHPSGLNQWYNQPGNRERVRAWLQQECEALGCFQDLGG